MELSIRANDMFIGTLLKSLEIEDLVSCEGVSHSRYLARSYIGSVDATLSFEDTGNSTYDNDDLNQNEGDDKFFEAPEDLVDFVDSPMQSLGDKYPSSQNLLSTEQSLLKLPSFSRIDGLLPGEALQIRGNVDLPDALDSFVKAQIIIYDQNSPLYNNVDKQVGCFLV